MATAISRITQSTQEFHKWDLEATDRYIGGTLFHPGYWSRARRDQAIAGIAHNASGLLLDVGCGTKPYQKTFAPFVTRHLGLEYSPDSGFRGNKADLFGDAAYLPFGDQTVDTILCSEVLEHVPDPEKVLNEFARVLKPDGVLITTAPFIYPIHDAHDYFRYSPDGLAVMMKRSGFTIDTVRPLSGTAVTLALLINIYVYSIGFMWTKWLYPFGVILRPLLLLLCLVCNIAGGIFERLVPSNHMALGHLTIAKKGGRQLV